MTTFQSTPSVWRETFSKTALLTVTDISIHSLRVEGDRPCGRHGVHLGNISIHSLRVEGDRVQSVLLKLHGNFNPLPPCGGRPGAAFDNMLPRVISIHSLRVEGDYADSLLLLRIGYFNPLPPCGGRPTYPDIYFKILTIFQSTPSVWRETQKRG